MGAGRPREDREIIDGVVKEFLALCAVPHGSWREGTLADLLAGRFRDRGWSVSRDDAGNLRADIPASPGAGRRRRWWRSRVIWTWCAPPPPGPAGTR